MEESVEALSERLATRSKRIPLLIGVGSIAPLIAVFLLWGRHDLWLSVLTVVLVAFLGLVVVGMAVSGAGNLRKAGQVLEGLPKFRLVRGKAFPPVIEGTTEANGIETPVAVAFSGETNFELAIPCRVQAHVSELRGVQLTELLENVKLWGSPRIA